MDRRSFFPTLFGGALGSSLLATERPSGLVLDYRNQGPLEEEWSGARCFVDGLEIRQAFFIDTINGIVKSYDACGDDKARHMCAFRATQELAELLEGRHPLYNQKRPPGAKDDWPVTIDERLMAIKPELDDRGVLIRTIRGNVTLQRPAFRAKRTAVKTGD